MRVFLTSSPSQPNFSRDQDLSLKHRSIVARTVWSGTLTPSHGLLGCRGSGTALLPAAFLVLADTSLPTDPLGRRGSFQKAVRQLSAHLLPAAGVQLRQQHRIWGRGGGGPAGPSSPCSSADILIVLAVISRLLRSC